MYLDLFNEKNPGMLSLLIQIVRKLWVIISGQGFWAAVFYPILCSYTKQPSESMMGFDGISGNVCMVSDAILFQDVLNSAGSKVSHALAML